MNKTIRSGTLEVIYKVFNRSLAEFKAGKLLTQMEDVFKRTADLTGKSESTVRRIVMEGKKTKESLALPLKIEMEYIERGPRLYENIEQLIIRVGDDSSSSSESDAESIDPRLPCTSRQDFATEDNLSGIEYIDFDMLDE